jgi:hypothetical protein
MLKKGDVISVAYRRGYDNDGNPIIETIERCEVESYEGGILKANCRLIGKSEDGQEQVEIHSMTFNINSPDFVGVAPKSMRQL